VVRDLGALDALARPLGARVIGDEDIRLLEWARAYFKARDLRKTMRDLENHLK
jgi:hypothetical protein